MLCLPSTSRAAARTCTGGSARCVGAAVPRGVLIPSCRPAPHHQRRSSPVVMHAEPEAAAVDPLAGADDPEMAQEAIDLGLKYTGAGRWTEALELFERALNMPGTGMKRYRDKPRIASDREKMTALYNIACCHSQLNDVRSGLVALAGCMELGYADFPQIRRDPDLAALRADERFEGLIRRFEPQGGAGFLGFDLGSIFGKK